MTSPASTPPRAWLISPSRDRRGQACRYWLRDPWVGFYRVLWGLVLPLLPTDTISNLGAALSRLGHRSNPAGAARARAAWRALSPEAADEAATEAAMARLWRHLGRVLTELSVLRRLWDECRIEVEGAEHLAAARADGRPILAVALHLGNWEAASLALARIGYPFTAVALILDNRFENRLATRMRQAYGARIIPGARARARDAVRALQSGGPLVLHIDEYSAGRVQAPAFGRPSSQGNLAYAIRLSAMTGAAVIPFYCERLGDAARFKVRILPEVEQIVTGDAAADHAANVANLNDLIEPIVRAHLDQWFYGLEFEFDS